MKVFLTPTLFFRSLTLGLTAYALVYTREVPSAYAETIVDTDCSLELNLPDTTYRLTTNATTSCIISANNIILDGQNLYSITGDVAPSSTAPISGSLTVRNVSSISGKVWTTLGTVDLDRLDIENTSISGYVDSNATSTHITRSTVSGFISAYDLVIDDSTIHQINYANDTTITNSTVTSYVNLNFYTGADITVDNSTIGYGIYNVNNATITNSTLGSWIFPYGPPSIQSVTLTNSTINGYANTASIATSTTCTITDSTITNPATVNCGTLNVTDNAPSLTVTPLTLSLEQGDSFNPFSGVSATDTKDGSLTGDVSVIGSVGTEPGTYTLVYSVTDHGTTLFNTSDNATTTVGPTTASTTRTVTRNGGATSTASEASSQATWVGHRSDGGGPTHTTDTSSTTATTTPTAHSLDTTLAQLRTVLAQPITTTDTTKLTKLVDLLTQLLAVLVQLIAKGG